MGKEKRSSSTSDATEGWEIAPGSGIWEASGGSDEGNFGGSVEAVDLCSHRAAGLTRR